LFADLIMCRTGNADFPWVRHRLPSRRDTELCRPTDRPVYHYVGDLDTDTKIFDGRRDVLPSYRTSATFWLVLIMSGWPSTELSLTAVVRPMSSGKKIEHRI
jgi:hypothetical protein